MGEIIEMCFEIGYKFRILTILLQSIFVLTQHLFKELFYLESGRIGLPVNGRRGLCYEQCCLFVFQIPCNPGRMSYYQHPHPHQHEHEHHHQHQVKEPCHPPPKVCTEKSYEPCPPHPCPPPVSQQKSPPGPPCPPWEQKTLPKSK